MYKVETKRYCDRCGAEMGRNEKITFHGKTSDGYLTGIKLMGCVTYQVKSMDLCDDCLCELIRWIGKESLTDRIEYPFEDEEDEAVVEDTVIEIKTEVVIEEVKED